MCEREREMWRVPGERTHLVEQLLAAYKSILMAVKNDKSQTLQHCRKHTNIPVSAGAQVLSMNAE